MFTIINNKLEILPIKSGEVFSSEGRSIYTTEFEKLGLNGFTNRYYDNTKGKTIEQYFTWDGREFVIKPISE